MLNASTENSGRAGTKGQYSTNDQTVIPAQGEAGVSGSEAGGLRNGTGLQASCTRPARGNPYRACNATSLWIPACAGMTGGFVGRPFTVVPAFGNTER